MGFPVLLEIGRTVLHKNIPAYAGLFFLLLCGTASASGFKIDQQGSKAMSMGDAFVAIADDPSAVYFNPAGLADQREAALYVGAAALAPSMKFRNMSGAEEGADDQVFLPPHLYLTWPYRNIALGLGIYAPFGLGTEWSDTGLTRYQATMSDIDTININPAVAMRVRPWLLLGAGVDHLRSNATLKKMVDQSAVGGSDATSGLEGDGSGWGYNAGIIVIPGERLSVGITYRSAISVDYSGSASIEDIAPALQLLFGGASYRTNANTTIEFPDALTIGAAYKPFEKITIGLDLERTGWSSFDKLDIDLENEIDQAGFIDSTETRDWEDIWAVRAGMEYRATERISVRGGYVYQNNPVPGHTLEPRLSDSDQHNISFGIGYSAENFVIDAAYMGAYLISRDVQNDILSGEYDTFGHSAGLSVGYKF